MTVLTLSIFGFWSSLLFIKQCHCTFLRFWLSDTKIQCGLTPIFAIIWSAWEHWKGSTDLNHLFIMDKAKSSMESILQSKLVLAKTTFENKLIESHQRTKSPAILSWYSLCFLSEYYTIILLIWMIPLLQHMSTKLAYSILTSTRSLSAAPINYRQSLTWNSHYHSWVKLTLVN